ncbi:MAG: tetratricopeptide repeat protein [Candidatus Sericytochromatia bacterium]
MLSEPFERHLQLGHAAYRQNDYALAWDHFQGLLDLDLGYVPAWVMLGNLALLAPDPALAVDYFHQALALDPQEKGIWLSLGQAFRELRQPEAAAAAYTAYLEAFPTDSDAWLLLAISQRGRSWTFHEVNCLERYLELKPHDFRMLRWLGMVRFYFGAWDWLETYFSRVLGQTPEAREWLAALPAEARTEYLSVRRLFELDYLRYLFTDPKVDDQTLFAWIRQCHASEPVQAPLAQRRWPPRRSGPLRVGYLSGEFGNFASALLVWPLYLNLTENVEMYIYDDTHPDEEARDFRPPSLRWRRIYTLSDEQVFRQIRADGIDVLADLTGITHQKRHGLYAMHPAPAQISGLGFVFSSGLACMDYCFSDKVLCPPEIEALYPEEVIHLPSAFHWQPPEAFALGEPPACTQGYVTLGAAHTLNRLQPEVVALWARILQQLPQACLFLKTVVLADPLTQALWFERFAEHGIAPARLRLEGHGSGHHVAYFYPQIDIALDPFPYSGGVTTSEALFMGVPVAVMDQPQWRSRALSVSIYTTLGLEDWLARSEDEYLERVVAWAQDLDFLTAQRQALRPRLLNSPICDGATFAREAEAAYEWMRNRAASNRPPA